MLDDLNTPLGAIRPDGKSLKAQILEVQHFSRSRDDSHKWASNLRFLKVGRPDDTQVGNRDETTSSHVESLEDEIPHSDSQEMIGLETIDDQTLDLDHSDDADLIGTSSLTESDLEPSCSCGSVAPFEKNHQYKCLELTAKDSLTDCEHYVAVSYCWENAIDKPGSSEKTHVIQTATGNRSNKAPSSIIDQAIAYAAVQGLGLIWIDQECIEQDDRDDKETGIQSMDLVYERSISSVGLLQRHVDSQDHLDALETLAQGAPCEPRIFKFVFELLEIVEGDRWFSRTWCLQEAVSSGRDMQLLLRCNPDLIKADDTGLGELEDAIHISIFELKTATVWAMQCIDDNVAELDYGMADRSSTLANHLFDLYPLHHPDDEKRVPCNAAQALYYMKGRRNSRLEDRLAILANMCNYEVRLDTRELKSDAYSLSVCCLTLSLLNGDLSYVHANERVSGGDWPPSEAFSWCPSPSSSITDIGFVEEDEIFRMDIIEISGTGLLTRGRIWNLDEHVDLTSVKHTFQEFSRSELWKRFREPGEGQPSSLAAAEAVWHFMKLLISCELSSAADLLWRQTKRTHFEPLEESESPVKLPNTFSAANKLLDELSALNPKLPGETDNHIGIFEPSLLEGYFLEKLWTILEQTQQSELWVAWALDKTAGIGGICAAFGTRDPLMILTPSSDLSKLHHSGRTWKRRTSWTVGAVREGRPGTKILSDTGLTDAFWRLEDVGDSEKVFLC